MDGKLKIALIVSVVVNLFLAGALGGVLVMGARFLHDRGPGGSHDRGRPPGVWTAFQAIPENRRDELRRLMREPAMEAASDVQAAREARRRAAEAIAAPTYDPEAVETALAEARTHDAEARTRIDAALAQRLSQLSPQERAVFAQIMMRGPGGGRDRRGFRRDGRDGRDGEGRPPFAPPPAGGPPPAAE